MPSFGQNLNAHKAKYTEAVNTAIGEARLFFITEIPGQQSIYAEKLKEAVDYIALSPATLDDYPFIAGAVGVDADTAYEVAQLWVNLQDIWKQAGAALETLRRTYITQIEAQTDRAGVDTQYDNFSAALDAFFNS